MREQATFLAVDLGVESRRILAASFDGQCVTLRELHRFPNEPVRVTDGLHWDVVHIVSEVKKGLAKAVTVGRHVLRNPAVTRAKAPDSGGCFRRL